MVHVGRRIGFTPQFNKKKIRTKWTRYANRDSGFWEGVHGGVKGTRLEPLVGLGVRRVGGKQPRAKQVVPGRANPLRLITLDSNLSR